jgi:hypothetical protein
MLILAIDPGTTASGVVVWCPHTKKVHEAHSEMLNSEVRQRLLNEWTAQEVVVEWIQAMGMAVGRETFETCRFIGRLEEIAYARNQPFHLITRGTVKMKLCGNMRAKDPNIRRALLDLYGEVGTKKTPGPLYGVSSHAWQALACAVAFTMP